MGALPNNVLPWTQGTGGQGATAFTRNEAQSFCRKLLNDQAYRDSLQKRLLNGSLPAAVEVLLFHYAYGKPADNVNMNVSTSLRNVPAAELAAAARLALQELEEAQAVQDAVDEEFPQP